MTVRRFGCLLGFATLIFAQSALAAQAMDPDNPTCPLNPGWSVNREMRLSIQSVGGKQVLLAEGVIDDNLLPRLEAALQDQSIQEIRLRSPGGDARIGYAAGAMIRRSLLPTHIPAGWACAGSCAFMFMGGIERSIAPGGLYIVQMFSVVGDREAVARQIDQGGDRAIDLMNEIARQSARVATEDNAYLIRMGVSRSLLTDIVYRQQATPTATDRSSRRCLTPEELRRYNVMNVMGPSPSRP